MTSADRLSPPSSCLRPTLSQTKRLRCGCKTHVKASIAPYKYPRAIHFVEVLPKTRFQLSVRQNVDADPDLADLGRLFENDRFNTAPMKHQRKRQSADAGARNEHLHGSDPSPVLTSPPQAAAGNRPRVWPPVRRLRQASARVCCGSPRRGRRADASATPRICI